MDSAASDPAYNPGSKSLIFSAMRFHNLYLGIINSSVTIEKPIVFVSV